MTSNTQKAPTSQETLQAMADQLMATGEYRVLRRLPARFQQAPSPLPADAAIGVILDTETTGLESTDKVLEIGLVAFAYSAADGTVYGIVDEYGALEDPGFELDESSAALRVNGITNEMVRSQQFDDERVLAMLTRASIVIAHKAGFDRPMTESRFPGIPAVAWGCSLSQIPWRDLGYGSSKLEYLLQELGFFFDAHRALEDCHALLHLLAQPAPGTDRSHLSLLLGTAFEPGYKLWAEGAPFHAKELLRGRGYRWHPGDAPGTLKAWAIEVGSDAEAKSELLWLKENVYGRTCSIPAHETSAADRFSTRKGRLLRLYSDN